MPERRRVDFSIATCSTAALVVLAFVAACRHDAPITTIKRDTVAPNLSVVFPDSGKFDRDSNGLVDVEIRWSDGGGRVDPASLKIADLDLEQNGPPGSDLVPTWSVSKRDSTGATLEETVPGLLKAGWHQLRVSVADSTGNIQTVTSAPFHLPPAAFNRSINLALHPTCQQEPAVYFALSGDGSHGYAPFHGCIAIFRTSPPDSVHFVDGVVNAPFDAQIALDPASGLAYIGGGGTATPGITVFDTKTEQVVATPNIGAGVAGADLHDTRVFVGEACTTGRIFVLDKATLQQLAVMDPNVSSGSAVCPNAAAFALSSDGSLGWAGIVESGLVSFDARSYSILTHTDIQSPFGDSIFGDSRDIALTADRWLYVARIYDGLDEYDLRTGAVATHYPMSVPPDPIIKELALSPDGSQLFVSANPDASGPDDVSSPILFSVPGLHLRYVLPPRTGRVTDAVLFHPDGRRVFLLAQFEVYIYIVRP